MLERYNEVKNMEENDPGCGNYSMTPPMGCGTPKGISPFTPTYSPCSSSSGPSPSPAERKTSLGFACQKFLMLFLIAPEVNRRRHQRCWNRRFAIPGFGQTQALHGKLVFPIKWCHKGAQNFQLKSSIFERPRDVTWWEKNSFPSSACVCQKPAKTR